LTSPSWDVLRFSVEALHGQPVAWPAQAPNVDLGAVTPSLLRLCLRKGDSAEQFGERLVRALAATMTKPNVHPAGLRGLARVPGLSSEVEGWARCLVRDLSLYKRGSLPWSAMDRGAVLAGPPGTGKSTLAKALAEEAGVPLVVGSYAEWQGARDGHLGSTLAAMRATFASARAQSPCVLLIDEVDSFPNRSKVVHDYRDYVRSVGNSLLQELDGPTARDGVVVVGTCNDASLLDPALLRPGRLERVLHLLPPDRAGVEAVLRVHLGEELRDEALADLAVMAHGMSGAEAEMAVRTAKRAARVLGRRLTKGDLLVAIAEARGLDLTASHSVVFH
jgi:SpoVK/Ycf46/Vps4 family AAA+-type ATPase